MSNHRDLKSLTGGNAKASTSSTMKIFQKKKHSVAKKIGLADVIHYSCMDGDLVGKIF